MVCTIFCFFYLLSNQHNNNYCASLTDKVARLNSITESKIVLLGNSNVAFGFDSELIENELEMPVVNMGLHGGLGNVFHEEMAKFNVTKGDIYILCHNTYKSTNELSDPVLTWITLNNDFELFQILRLQDIWPMIKAYPQYLRKTLDSWVANIRFASDEIDSENVYLRSAFNEYGDIKVQRIENEYQFEKVSVPKINEDTINRINALAQWLQSKGATLVIAGYPIGNGQFTPAPEEYATFQTQLENAVDCDIISNFTDYMFDYKYFYDTNLHLTSEGAKLRSQQLIKDLKEWMKKGAVG